MSFQPVGYASFLAWGKFADLYLEESSSLSLRWEDGRLDESSSGTTAGAGLRFVTGDETAFGHLDARSPVRGGFSPVERQRLHRLARELRGRFAPLKARAAQPPRKTVHPVKQPFDSLKVEAKVRLLQDAEKVARRDPHVRQVSVTYGERVKHVVYVNSLGEAYEEKRPYLVFAVQVTAENGGLLQTAMEVVSGLGGLELLRRHPPKKLAALAMKRAVAKLSAPTAPAGEMPVVISSAAGGTLIHEAIGHSLEADAIQQGSSPHFAGKVGLPVANPLVTVLDDPTRGGARGSYSFDDEGTPSQRTVLVENGVLKTYLYDRRTAQKDNRPSNGHGRRESYAHVPIPRMSNTSIAPGKDLPEDILASLKKGLFVTRMGGGQVNTATGDFVFEVEEGFWVEGGKVQYLVRGANLLGNGPEVLRTIDRVGNDIGWSVGTCGKDGQGVPVSDGVPTLRIPKLVIGGGTAA